MRKQTKLVAVASAAALLAIGASMTAFAAAGWVEEDGVWYYYDSDGNRVEDDWKKSGDNWYWLDSEENGAMATDKLIEDDDNTYYVDSNGVMVTNTWVMVVNEDQDDDDDPAEYNYYYMQSNGKAYKGNGTSVQKKTINGKQYAFDEDGKMLYGWVDEDGGEMNGEDDWAEAMYYFGSWEDGSLKTGWQKIRVYDSDGEKDDDYDYWFNFKSNGKKRVHEEEDQTWKSNGKYYHFDERGVMVYEWFEMTSDSDYSSTSSWRYFSSPEDGARLTKGWFKVVPPEDDNSYYELDDTFAQSDSDDEDERWYYADSDGVLAVGEIKKIKGKYYGFWPDDGEKGGRMLTGLCALRMGDYWDAEDPDGSRIEEVIEGWSDMDSDDLDDFMDYVDGKYKNSDNGIINSADDAIYLYYFGADNDQDYDGAMKTGTVNINLDGDTYTFYFRKSGGVESRGRSVSGIDDDYVYKFGQRIKADSDEKYRLVRVIDDNGADAAYVYDYDASDIRSGELNLDIMKTEYYKNYNAETGKHGELDENIRFIDFRLYSPEANELVYLVNTSGKTQTGKKSGVKDGDDWYWYTVKRDGNNIVIYANSKNFAKSVYNKDLDYYEDEDWTNGYTGKWGTSDNTMNNPGTTGEPDDDGDDDGEDGDDDDEEVVDD